MREIILLAGPNGAGKTSFANEYLPAAREGLAYVNVDEVTRQLLEDGTHLGSLDIAAGRRILQELDELVSQRADFMIETTLSSALYARRIPVWKSQGYWISLIYLRLSTVEASIDRVRRRALAGGHSIPEHVIRRRFARSLNLLEHTYKPIVDDWYVWDSLEGDFKLSEMWDGR